MYNNVILLIFYNFKNVCFSIIFSRHAVFFKLFNCNTAFKIINVVSIKILEDKLSIFHEIFLINLLIFYMNKIRIKIQNIILYIKNCLVSLYHRLKHLLLPLKLLYLF